MNGALRGLVLLAALTLAACHGPQNILDPAGKQAQDIDVVWRTMLVVCGLMYLLVMAFLGSALWRARRKPSDDALPIQSRTAAEGVLDRTLTGWIGLIVTGLIVLVSVSFLVDRSLADVGPDPLRIKVTANQWWWDVEYQGQGPSERVLTANELRLPVGRPAVVELHANDVIHSFWVPNLSGKTDLIPGRVNFITLTPTRTGAFRGQCAEFCGLEHAKMAFDVQVTSPQEFEAWRRSQLARAADPTGPLEIQGKQIFNGKACAMCHRVQGTDAGAGIGPDLTHLKSRATIAAGTLPNTRGDLQAWVADPQGVKPGTTMPRVPLTASELNAVVAYLETLR
ncbi:cytochrome c oxidase subunit II [Phenylobacterium deserti]|uniref:cytochrome-c oxidase n=1 Tax=Phenylobacterium deserti TaxID=1914756 RepID=A0A328AVG6_9CAUL|nr:cytochrome c oxidase subunit II [Phenylobacterium deserti]RAK56918.1 cytochrome c oxidase subunit II [Phenylobacterium deserti]